MVSTQGKYRKQGEYRIKKEVLDDYCNFHRKEFTTASFDLVRGMGELIMQGIYLQENLQSTLKNLNLPKLYGRLKLADFLRLPEKDFFQLVKEMEREPLFKRLFFSENADEKIIFFKRFPKTALLSGFQEFKEEMFPSQTQPDIENFLSERKELLERIKLIGAENFKKYFLYGAFDLKINEIKRKLKLTSSEISEIFSLVDDIQFLDCLRSHALPAEAKKLRLIASIEIDNKDSPLISYFLPFYARGRYVIDYKRLVQLVKENKLIQGDLGRARRLFRALEMINIRKTLLYDVIEKLAEIQAGYLKSQDENKLKPLTQKILSHMLSTSHSSINRIIAGKSLKTPWGEEKPMKFFFHSRKKMIKNLIREILSSSRSGDEEMRKILEENHGVKIARRTVCAYRNEMKL